MSFSSMFFDLPLTKENNKAVSEAFNELHFPTDNVIKTPASLRVQSKQELIQMLINKEKDVNEQIRYMTGCEYSIKISAEVVGISSIPCYSFLADDEIKELIINHLRCKLIAIKELLLEVEYPDGFMRDACKILGVKEVENGTFIPLNRGGK